MQPPLRIGLLDDQRVLADALCFRLSRESQFQVAFAAETTAAVQAALREKPVDVLLLDAALPLGETFDLAAEVRRDWPATRIAFLVGRHESDALIDQALRLRADGILSRAEPLSCLVVGLAKVGAGKREFSPAIADRLEHDPARGDYRLRGEPASKGLTDRQLEILRHLARGESVKSVARKLLLSPKSVDNQKFRIMHKVGVRDKVSLALFAVREGLIQP
ncbi:MAG: LuxR C-terminal-related transcriptional regulator [Planctomycetaceae bacterium]